MLRRIIWLTLFSALLIFGANACGGVSINVQVNSTPIATAQIQLATHAAPTETTARATRPPATRRAVTPTRTVHANGLEAISRADLPPQARETLELIAQGGPFPYRQDGQVFQNREGLLPKNKNGYYHEYTVETPGSADRGARRIITGAQGELYYTDDHYASFKVIVDE